MKERLDVLLVNRNLAESMEKAKAIIMSGNVFVNGQREDKVGSTFKTDAKIEIRGEKLKYVSRGGLKLEKAIEVFSIKLDGRICMDVGASTGGFTDCMLQEGALKVYAIDVGTNQLDWRLRQDKRVISMERTNIRYITSDKVPDKVSFVSIDVSFISLTKVLKPVMDLMADESEMVCLIKPQFEADREQVEKGGVVRDEKVHMDVIQSVQAYGHEIGFDSMGIDYSPIKGPEGNIEYLLYLKKRVKNSCHKDDIDTETNTGHLISQEQIRSLVMKAHNEL